MRDARLHHGEPATRAASGHSLSLELLLTCILSLFFPADDRIAKGNNLTKMGSGSNPRRRRYADRRAGARSVDCPTLQAIGPQAANQAVKAIAIARTFLKESQSIDICMQPEFFQLEDGHSGLLLPIRKKQRRARSGEDEAQSLKAASGTDAKVLAGAISSFAREGRRMVVTGIGAASINQIVKAIAIARKNIEEEAIDLTCKPEFTEVNEGVTALRMLLLVEQT